MKKLMMIAVMAVACLTASAQNTLRDNGSFTLQPKVGIGFGMIEGSWTTAPNVDNKTRTGFLAGVEGEYYANEWLGIAAGLTYAQQGWKFEGGGNTVTTKLDYLNVPITANFYVAQGLALKTGLQMGFLMNAKDESVDIKDACEKFNLAIPIGLSYEYQNIVLDARYNLAVTKVNKNGNDDNKWRSSLIQITLGYKFKL
jgi:opacity protein-like surface antigen